jgi:hypothetical protein
MAQNIPYKLRNWIDATQFKWCFLSENPNAIGLLRQNPDKISLYLLCDNPNEITIIEDRLEELDEMCWVDLCRNPNAIPLLERHIDKWWEKDSHWNALSANPNAMHWLKEHPDKISFKMLCNNTNPEAMKILEENYDKIHWPILCANPSAISLIERRLTEPYIPEIDWLDFRDPRPYKNIDWNMLSMNPNALHILKNNPERINYMRLCSNKNPEAIRMLEQNMDEIDWPTLASNPSAIQLLEANQEKVRHLKPLAKNPAIFVYDYEMMKRNHMDLKEELIRTVWSPTRVATLIEKYNLDPEDL